LKPSNKVNHGVYLVGAKEHGWYKIGVSTNFDGRLKSLSTGVPFPIEKMSYSIVGYQFLNSLPLNKRRMHVFHVFHKRRYWSLD